MGSGLNIQQTDYFICADSSIGPYSASISACLSHQPVISESDPLNGMPYVETWPLVPCALSGAEIARHLA